VLHRKAPWALLASVLLIVALGLVGCSAVAAQPTMKIVAPADGATVQGPKVKVEVAVTDWKLVPAGTKVADGEGHLHFFVDVPASAVAVGQLIPPTTANPAFIHAGAEPLTSRELTLTPGTHTITVVMGNSSHVALANPAPQSITIHVQ
jgi:Domain of unknown function (DUF4399)